MPATIKLPNFKLLDANTRDALLLTSSFLIMAACITLFVVLIRQPNPHVDPHKVVKRVYGRPARVVKP